MRLINERGIEIVKSFEGLPFSLTFALGELFLCGLWLSTVGSVGGPIDPDMEVISEVEALPYVTWNLPKDGFVALLKRHLPKISIPF